jgi:D-alanyl-D-alanine carboxypeptidase
VSIYSVSAFVGQSDDWRLLLANRNNVIDNYEPEVTRIPREHCQDSQNYRIDSRVYDELMAMILAAEEDGVKLTVVSSYRPYSSQQRLYNNKVNYYINRGYSRANAELLASTVVAIPGTSDLNLGLAVDFNYLEQSDENKPELVWLRENAEQYGFVMRYPKNKENVTGVIYEPWHYRYVGAEHAKMMNEMDYCLEQYLAYLQYD